MSQKVVTNIAASVRERLQNQGKKLGIPFQEVLTLYAMERILYRLGQSPHVENFILKGAMMLRVWDATLTRPTLDIDLLGPPNLTASSLQNIIESLLTIKVADDGLVFDPKSIEVHNIRNQQKYHGLRVRFTGKLGVAKMTVQIDVGLGDVVVPSPTKVTFPILLDQPNPLLLGYPPETSIAEKFVAMVELGAANSRMKDFYDIWMLSERRVFEGDVLAAAIEATFKRRQIGVPLAAPLALTAAFFEDPNKINQWQIFIQKVRAQNEAPSFENVAQALISFLMPTAKAISTGKRFPSQWAPGKGWQEKK
jgi:predicted nucleotidyltransferase component of viral defense system